MRDTPIIFLSNQIFSGPGNVAQLSTSIDSVFVNQTSNFTTSNLNTSSFTLSGGNMLLSNAVKAELISTSLNIFNGNFLQSNTFLNTGGATFCNTNVTVNGALSTTGLNFMGGPLLANSFGSISSLAIGAIALAPPSINAALDVNGTMRGRLQIVQFNGTSISPVGGNSVYFNLTSNISTILPSVTSTLGGTHFFCHKDTNSQVVISSIAGQLINGIALPYNTSTSDKYVSIMQIGAAWNIISG